MAVVMSDDFTGTVGASFTGDTTYTNIAGTAPTYQTAAHGKALRFPAAAQSIIGETFTAATVRTFSRIYKLSGAPTANVEVLQTRSAAARGPTLSFSSANHLRIVTGTAAVFLVTGTANLPIGTEFRVTFTVNGSALTATVFADTTTATPLETISGTDPNGVTTMVSARDGFMAATAAGAGVTMDLSWPADSDNTTDPGPRAYGGTTPVPPPASTLMSDDFTGTAGAAFTGDSVYTNLAGTAPTYQVNSKGGKALRFAAGQQGIIAETFTATTTRVFSRIYKLSAAATLTSEVCQARVGTARGPALAFTDINTLRLLKTDGSAAATGAVQLPVAKDFRVTFTVSTTTVTAALFPDVTSTVPLETISGPLAAAASMTACRDGIITATALGAAVSLDLSWPIDTADTDPGPRTYPTYTATPPQAKAGADLADREPGEPVTLVGAEVAGTNPITARAWAQVANGAPTVTLSGTGATRTFTPPASLTAQTYQFRYTVTASDGAVSDTVDVVVLPVNERITRAGVAAPVLFKTAP